MGHSAIGPGTTRLFRVKTLSTNRRLIPISYQSAKHFRSSLTEEGGKREGRPEGRGGRPDVVILADNMKSGASSDRASNFPQAASAAAGGAVAGAAGAVVAASKHTSASASQFEEDILTI